MASIANDPGGRRRILFTNPQGDRKAIRLGKCSMRTVESIKFRVEQLLEYLTLGQAKPADLAQWVVDLEPVLEKKLAAVDWLRDPRHRRPWRWARFSIKTSNCARSSQPPRRFGPRPPGT